MAAVDKIEEKRKPEDFIGHRNRRAAHADVKQGTKEICRKIAFLSKKYTKKRVFIWLNQNP